MAAATKRLSRKQIRQPDRFLELAGETADFVRRRKPLVLAAAVLLLAILIGMFAWSAYRSRQNVLAARDFVSAMEHYRAGRYQEAIASLKTVQGYRWSNYAALAHLYEANSYLALRDPDRALPAAQRFLAATRGGSLYRQIALTTLGEIELARGNAGQAVEHFAEAERIAGPLKEQALLGKARAYVALGDPKGAVGAYRQYLGENPTGELAAQIEYRIGQLEPELAVQP